MACRLGLIVNPVAGIGGRLALKGSDDRARIAAAREAGAQPVAGPRAVEALAVLAGGSEAPELLVAAGPMGAEPAAAGGPRRTRWSAPRAAESTADDTRAAAAAMAGGASTCCCSPAATAPRSTSWPPSAIACRCSASRPA